MDNFKLDNGTHLTIVTHRYYLSDVEKLLGIMQGILKIVIK